MDMAGFSSITQISMQVGTMSFHNLSDVPFVFKCLGGVLISNIPSVASAFSIYSSFKDCISG